MYDVADKFDSLKRKDRVVVLGIESSCDETAAAVVVNGREILSNVISSQVPIHRLYGGVVPEVASRNHIMAIGGVIDEALSAAGTTIRDVDAVAVTYGAGLAGALLVGVTAAKALAYAAGLPLVKVDHIEGHVAANYLAHAELAPPFFAVVASGGHTLLLDVPEYNDFRFVGGTTDDALGEAFDKTARLLGLPYPGGPEVDRLAKLGKNNIPLVRATGPKDDFSLSYSGLKTAVVNYVHNMRQRGEKIVVEDVCASLQTTAVDILVRAVTAAVKRSGRKKVVLAGGVAANSYLRSALKNAGKGSDFEVFCPPPVLCTDNAAMIAARAYYEIRGGVGLAGLDLNAEPSLATGRRP